MLSAWRLQSMLALSITCGAGLTAEAAVVPNDAVVHYPIYGANEDELRREMNAKGPTGGGASRYDGYTRWNISWRYQYQSRGGECRLTDIVTDVKVTMTLPDWRNEGAAPERLRSRWRQYLAALTVHEMGHRRHGMDAAREIDHSLGAMPPQADCSALGKAANALGDQIIKKYNERDLEYDRSTGHGRSQNARFP
jgi:predicted secreted Zn-dependent protease